MQFPSMESQEELLDLLEDVIDATSIKEVASMFNVVPNTVERWFLLGEIPRQYYFDLAQMTGFEIDYSKHSFRDKDQFFTPSETATYCYNVLCRKLEELGVDETKVSYVEPSAGSGNFLNVLPPDRRIGLDIEPRSPEIIEGDYLSWKPETDNNIVIGNPPFGLRGHLALRFMNHSSKFADFVAFILPQLFESDGKGSPKKRVQGYNLIHSEKLDTSFVDPEGKTIPVNTVFQIWSKEFSDPSYVVDTSSCDKHLKVYSLSDGGTPGTTRNKPLLDKCDVYLPSTCFGEDKMKVYKSFEDLPGRKGYGVVFLSKKNENKKVFENINWAQQSFKSTNSAFNLRTSIIKKAFIDNKT